MNLKQKIANWIFENISFPKGCESGNEQSWWLKNNCPCCLYEPIESLSNYEYHKKYPANNVIHFGKVSIYICDYHLKELNEELNK